jgi:hypothetical protein
MFTSFEQAPRILRLFCKGKVVEFWEDGFLETTREMGMEVPVGARAVIVLDIFKVCFSSFLDVCLEFSLFGLYRCLSFMMVFMHLIMKAF